MLHHLGVAHAHTFVRRASQAMMGKDDDLQEINLPLGMIALIVVLNFILFIPILLYCFYTLANIYPTLAIVEDEAPPAYEPLAMDDDLAADSPDAPAQSRATQPTKTDGETPRAVSSSLRLTGRLLRADSGRFAGYLKGFWCAFFMAVAAGLLQGIFSSVLSGPFSMIAVLFAMLALVQVSAAWVHIVITPASARPFWRRLPAFKKTFDATAKPTVAYWAAQVLTIVVPGVMAWALGIPMSEDDFQGMKGEGSKVDPSLVWKGSLVSLVALFLGVLLQVPLMVVLIRIQASLLPAEESTLIAFDRSFQGRVDPAVVTGKGYATMADAWYTFSRASWIRLIKLYAKILAVTIFASFFMMLVVAIEMVAVAASTTKGPRPH